MDDRELRVCQRPTSEESIAARDCLCVATVADVSEQLRKFGVALALLLERHTTARAVALGSGPSFALAGIRQPEATHRNENHVATFDCDPLAPVVDVELPAPIRIAPEPLRDRVDGFSLAGDVRDDRRNLDFLTFYGRNPGDSFVRAREQVRARYPITTQPRH